MKNRKASTAKLNSKKVVRTLLFFSFLSTIVVSTALTIPTYAATDVNESIGENLPNGIGEASSDVIIEEFDESNFPGMEITYDENGVPIVVDPTPIRTRISTAKGRFQNNGFYTDKACTKLSFWVPRGSIVKVHGMHGKTCTVEYANTRGYMKMNELIFN